MSFLTQNINLAKKIKKGLDEAGQSLRTPYTSKRNLDGSRVLKKQRIKLQSFDVWDYTIVTPILKDWKTVVVDVNDKTFYIGLDMAKSFSIDVSLALESDNLEYLLNNCVKYSEKEYYYIKGTNGIIKMLGSDMETVRKELKSVLSLYTKFKGYVENVTYTFNADGSDIPSFKIFKKYLKLSKSVKYAPLFWVSSEASDVGRNGDGYYCIALCDTGYSYITYSFEDLESLIKLLSVSSNYNSVGGVTRGIEYSLDNGISYYMGEER